MRKPIIAEHVAALHCYQTDRFLCIHCSLGLPDVLRRLADGDGSVAECEVWNLDLEAGEVFRCDLCAAVIAEDDRS